MPALIPIIIIVLLEGFWLWMLREMAYNPDIPPNNTSGRFNWPPISKVEWAFLFVLLNVAAAGFYYFVVYKEIRR
ncbi:MAG TPA: hypothetical protein VFW77_03070 [Candidatus Saccharimonadales bacterium]|nr:hypothetical protein [Candidatus Saccharimonadales bacterium]